MKAKRLFAYDLTDNLGKVLLLYYSAEQKAIYTLDNVIDFKTVEKEPIVRVIRF